MSKLLVTNRYATTPNHILNNPSLSLRAKGLRGYIQSKPDGWDFSIKRIANQSKDGEKSVRAGIKELEEHGYLVRNPVRKTNGDFGGYNYTLAEMGSLPNASTPNASTPNGITLSKQDNSKQEIVKKIEVEHPKSILSEIHPAQKDEALRFVSYWTEPFVRGRMKGRERWEGEETWSLKRRWATWMRNKETNFGRDNHDVPVKQVLDNNEVLNRLYSD